MVERTIYIGRAALLMPALMEATTVGRTPAKMVWDGKAGAEVMMMAEMQRHRVRRRIRPSRYLRARSSRLWSAE